MNVLRVLYIGFLLCLCAGCVDSLPVTAVLPTPTIQTPSPTLPKPSATPIPTSSPTVTATVVKKEVVAATAVPPSPTPIHSPHLAYSLVTTPVANQEYQLRSWDEQFFASLLADAQKIGQSHGAKNISYEIRPGLIWPQFADYVQTINQEFLLKYPTSQSLEQINWRLVHSETRSLLSISAPALSTQPFVALLQNEFETGALQPENMRDRLMEKGFNVTWQREVENLLNDHRSQWVVQVESQLDRSGYIAGSVILILARDPQTNYHVVSVREYWLPYNNTSGGGAEIVNIADFDHDGQPEIFSVHSGWYHLGCHATLRLYRWNGEQFDNLAAQFGDSYGFYDDSNCQNVWALSQAGHGYEFLTQTLRGGYFLPVDCLPYVKQVDYEWDGQQFQKVKEEGVLPEKAQTAVCQFLWDSYNNTTINGTPFFIDRLNNWPDDLSRILGEHSKAYYQWKAGVWYAKQGQFDQARILWKPLQESSSTLVSRLAETYTQIYQSPKNAYAACSAAVQIVTDELQQHGYQATQGVLQEEFIDIWGLWEPTWHPFQSLPESNICSQREALATTFTAVNHSDPTTLMAELMQLAIPFLVGQPKREGLPPLLLINVDENYWYIWVDGDQELNSTPLYGDFHPPVSFEILPFRFGDNDMAYDLIVLADELIVRQNESGQPPVEVLDTGNVESYELLNEQELVTIRVKNLGRAEWVSWLWNEEAQRFFPMELPSQLQTIEKLLQEGDFSEAIATNSETFPTTPIDLQPKQLYLLGLAYELNHEDVNAIATYLNLWQTFPESPYAIMARLKLEPVP